MSVAPESMHAVDGALVEFRSVTKWYGAVIGVNDVSVALEPGITGLLGPNGAGKTTLIKLLTGQLRPSLGEIRVCGNPAHSARARRHIGYCPDADAFYEEMSGRQFVRTMARLHGMSATEVYDRTEQALSEVGMSDRADRTLRGCSKGMRQRIKLAQALVHQPDVLIVDEPLNGIDPVGRRELMDLFRRCAARGQAVLVSSHILDEMDELADRIVFMGRGRVLAVGSLPEIRAMFAGQPLQIRIACRQQRELATQLIGWEHVSRIELAGADELLLQVIRPEEFFARLATLVVETSFDITHMESTDATTEATFQYVMSAAARF
ncbi:MAG TPA: ABC transporter ATP-binding protein [Schlesneria sp.]